MVTTTAVYSFQKPDVSGDEDAWGGYLNANVDKYESILTGNTTITSLVITTADINGGTLDNVVIGGTTAAAVTGTTITGTGFASTGNMTFGEGNKALFGASSDLEIYHNGTNSVIYDNGAGNLQLVSGGASVNIIKAGGENMANFVTDGAVTLYYDNAAKITTASTGAIILHDNGNYDDGLTLRSTKDWGYGTSLSFDAIATSGGSNATVGKIQSRWQSTGNHALDFYTYGGGSLSQRMRIDSSGNVGIGTSSPSSYHANANNLVIQDSGNTGITIATTDSAYFSEINFADGTSGAQAYAGILRYAHSDNSLRISVNASEAMRITSDGSVGIGTASPNSYTNYTGLTVNGGSTGSFIDFERSGVFEGEIIATENQFGVGAVAASGVLTLRSGGNTERMRIDSSGNVLIGTTTSGLSSQLTVEGTAITIRSGTTGNCNLFFSDGTSGNAQYRGYIYYSHSTDHLGLGVSGFEAVRIDSSGNVGIGTASPTSYSTYRYLDIVGSATTTGGVLQLKTSDGSVNLNMYSYWAGGIFGTATNHNLSFITNNSTRVVIDSSGNLLVGTTDSTPYNNNAGSTADNGIALSEAGWLAASRYQGTVAFLNRTDSDGDIAVFRKDGSTVGSIGGSSNILSIVGKDGNGGIAIQNNSFGDIVYPASNSSGGASDNAIDLGYSSGRFKDLYLSGGVYLGGTGSANKLDDYESGTFTPQIADAASGGNSTTTGSTIDGHYVKVGDLVYVSVRIIFPNTSGLTSGNVLYIRNLPFTCFSVNGAHPLSIGTARNIDYSYDMITAQINSNATYFNLESNRSDASEEEITCGQFSGDGTASSPVLYVAGTYRTT